MVNHSTLRNQARSHLGLGRDIFPGLLVKLETPALYLSPEKSPVHVAERGVSAQKDVDDHAHAPHVDRLQRGFLCDRQDEEAGTRGGSKERWFYGEEGGCTQEIIR